MRGEQQGTSPGDGYDVDSAVQRALERLTVLANANEVLASTFEVETALRRLARILVSAGYTVKTYEDLGAPLLPALRPGRRCALRASDSFFPR